MEGDIVVDIMTTGVADLVVVNRRASWNWWQKDMDSLPASEKFK